MTGNRISQAYVELTTKGEGRVRRTLGALKGDMKTLDAQTKTTESRLEKLGKGADGLQGALGKLLMPIAFIGAVAGVEATFDMGSFCAATFLPPPVADCIDSLASPRCAIDGGRHAG